MIGRIFWLIAFGVVAVVLLGDTIPVILHHPQEVYRQIVERMEHVDRRINGR